MAMLLRPGVDVDIDVDDAQPSGLTKLRNCAGRILYCGCHVMMDLSKNVPFLPLTQAHMFRARMRRKIWLVSPLSDKTTKHHS